MLARLEDRPVATALLIGLAAQLLFLFHLGWPTAITFDEVHYVPAARSLLALDLPRNTEHPLFAKELIALGMALFGDNPIGWRIAASLAGSATVMGVFAFVWLLVRDRRAAVIAALLAILNQTLFIEARIAMLDPFLGAFVIWGIVLLLWSMRAKTRGAAWTRWIAGGVCLGLAVACKWTAAPYLVAAGCGFFWVRWRDSARIPQNPVRPELVEGRLSTSPVPVANRPSTSSGRTGWRKRLARILSGRDQPHWPGLPAIPALLVLGLVSIATYFLTFLPAFFYREDPLTLSALLPFQLAMYASQTQVLRAHPYQSSWWTWPLAIRPIWYFYEYDAGAQRGVLLLGNPVIMWGGLVAVLACFWTWFRTRAAAPLAVALLWVFSLLIWAIIPKSLGFYYYYYLSSILLCPPLALALRRYAPGRETWFVGASLVAFVYFYPIISAWPLSGPNAFNHWMWFDSWR